MKLPMPRFLARFLPLAFLALLALFAGCSTVDVGRAPRLDAGAAWAVLPFSNHTETPQAGLRAEAIAENLLRAEGGLAMKRYPAGIATETLFEPGDRKQLDAALAWARKAGVRYALTGSVDEWRYKVGVDGEPAAGVTLQLIDVASGDVLWAATGARTGWSREALSAVAQQLMKKLLGPILSLPRGAA
jgi:TolB-like protein